MPLPLGAYAPPLTCRYVYANIAILEFLLWTCDRLSVQRGWLSRQVSTTCHRTPPLDGSTYDESQARMPTHAQLLT